MIIRRKKKKEREPAPEDLLYFSTSDDLDGKTIAPGIPNTMFTRQGYEDPKTKRISLFPRVGDFLMWAGAEGKSLTGKTFYVYVPGGFKTSLFKTTLPQTPIGPATNEYWYLKTLRLRYLTSVTVGKKIPGSGVIYHYGPRSTKGELYKWEWTENLKPWEKIGKLPEQREFGVVSDLSHSGIGRTYKKYVGRARRSLGNVLGRNISRDAEKYIQAGKSVGRTGLILNKTAGDTLNDKAHELSAHIYKSPERETINYLTGNPIDRINYTRDSYTISESLKSELRK